LIAVEMRCRVHSTRSRLLPGGARFYSPEERAGLWLVPVII
jgi:hypothetical protein